MAETITEDLCSFSSFVRTLHCCINSSVGFFVVFNLKL